MPLILAIDQSTSTTKAVLFDEQGTVIDRASRDHVQHVPAPQRVEHDAGEIWDNVQAVAGTLATRNADRFCDIAGVSLANQRETFVVFDRATGHPLRRAIVWQDRRGDAVCRLLAEQDRGGLVHQRTGLSLDGYFSGSKIRRLLDEEPRVRREVVSGQAVIGTIDAYLVHRLTNGRTCAGDSTNASRTLLFDIDRLAWDVELGDLFGVPPTALPEVRESAATFGETDLAGTLPRPVPIVGVIGASHASLFAQRCFSPGTAKATFGTGTSILFNAGHERPAAAGRAATALAWVLGGRPTYALEGMINSSAATIAWLRDRLGLITDAAESEPIAASIPDTGGVYLVPAFAGLSPPYAAADPRAAIVGLTAHSGREQVVRAGLEAIGYQVRDVLAMLAGQAGVVPAAMCADGGPTRNAFLMQFVADITGVGLAVTDVVESSALGAAMMGMLGLGWQAAPSGFADLPRTVTAYRPRMPAADVARLVRGWQDAVRRVELAAPDS